MLDAPVSGGTQGAKSGEFTFMVGGNRDVYEKVKFLFTFMGNRAIDCGKIGNEQSAKICNNLDFALYGKLNRAVAISCI